MTVCCDYCENGNGLQFECNYCQGRYCGDHRLPEEHECDGVEFLTGQQWFRDKSTDEVVTSSKDFESPEPIEPDYTVGTTPSPDFESSPEVELRPGGDEAERSSYDFLKKILRRIF